MLRPGARPVLMGTRAGGDSAEDEGHRERPRGGTRPEGAAPGQSGGLGSSSPRAGRAGPPSRDRRPRGSGPRGEQVASWTRARSWRTGTRHEQWGLLGVTPGGVRPIWVWTQFPSLYTAPGHLSGPWWPGPTVSACASCGPRCSGASPRWRRGEPSLSPSHCVPSARGSCPPPARGGTRPPSWKALLSSPAPARCPGWRERACRRDHPRGNGPPRQHGGGTPAQRLQVLAPPRPQPRDSWDMSSVVSVTIRIFGYVSPQRWERCPHNVGGRSS